MMRVYEFKNIKRNIQSRWSRFFVAVSLRDAKEQAHRFEDLFNDANGNIPRLLLTFDYENVNIVKTKKFYHSRGYIELETTGYTHKQSA